tara:strand:- start:465 stop:689 length:225 start_codon:yes stop_codon:yes gene_type:complete
MNFIVFGVVAPIAYFILRFLVKRLVMNFLQNLKRNTNIKNMTKCENCGIFISEEDIKFVDGRNICNKPECKNNV